MAEVSIYEAWVVTPYVITLSALFYVQTQKKFRRQKDALNKPGENLKGLVSGDEEPAGFGLW
jgi:hypothetical protein